LNRGLARWHRGYNRSKWKEIPAFDGGRVSWYHHRPMSKETKDQPDSRLFDLRNVERNIKRGLITRKDYDKHLKALNDAKDKIRRED
jgi:hypothetical protein